MTRVAKSTLVLVALVAAVAAYVLTGSFLGAVTPIGFGWVTLVAIAVVDVLLSLRIRAAISDESSTAPRSSTSACASSPPRSAKPSDARSTRWSG